MKTQSNALLVDKLYRRIADAEAKLKLKQDLYTAALKDDEPFEKTKELRLEIKALKQLLQELQAVVIISNHLAEY